MIQIVCRLLGSERKSLYRPVALLVLDTVFSMSNYAILYSVLINLLYHTLTFNKVVLFLEIMIAVFVLRLIVNMIGYSGIQIAGARAVEKMRIDLGDHLRKIHLGYFNKNSIGHLSNIMLNDIADFERVLTHSLSDLIKTVLLTLYLAGMAFLIEPTLAAIQLLLIMAAIPIILIGGNYVTKIGDIKKKSIASMISRIVEYLSGMQLFKAYGLTGERFQRLESALLDFKKQSIRTELSIVPFVLLFQIIVDLSFPILLTVGAILFNRSTIDAKTFLTFTILNLALTNILRAFGAQYGEFRYLKLSSLKLINTYEQPTVSYDYEQIDLMDYSVEFDDVNFAYESDQPVLRNLSFKVPSGKTLALIGPSGSGKTTITSLMARFWDIQKGCIRIGGINISTINPDALLKNISMVFQDVYLLHDTLYNNIKIGRQKASRKEVVAAAKQANIHDYIISLPLGYDTVIGEGGSTLSGGEKQRLSIARALLKNAPIILLDEATASLDADNEYEIRQSIDLITKNKTVIIIAHRLHTIRDADQILVLDEGTLSQMGTHDELLSQNGWYARMCS